MIEVVELAKEHEDAYSEFVRTDERAMIYSTLEFRNFLQQILIGKPQYFLALDSSGIAGVFPSFAASDAKFGLVVNSLPWYGSHGGCVMRSDAASGVRQALLSRYREMIAAPDVAFSTLILTPFENRLAETYLAILKPTVTDGRIGQITDLPESGPDLEARLERVFAQKTRNLVRKARKQGFTLEFADDTAAWQFLYETHVENMAGIGGKAKPLSHFEALRAAIPTAWRQLMLARLDGAPVAAMLLLRYNRTVEYVTPVIKHEFRSLQPLSFLIWHGMIDAVHSGFRWWNWGGTWTTQKTLHHFKAGWGAKDQPYTYIVHAKPAVLEAIKAEPQAVAAAFPFYFTYPFHLLQ